MQKSIFNLNDDDDGFTHKGQVLQQIDRYDDPRDLSDSDEERLDGNNLPQCFIRTYSAMLNLFNSAFNYQRNS